MKTRRKDWLGLNCLQPPELEQLSTFQNFPQRLTNQTNETPNLSTGKNLKNNTSMYTFTYYLNREERAISRQNFIVST